MTMCRETKGRTALSFGRRSLDAWRGGEQEMKAVVVYASRHGNTEKIAFAIAAGLRMKMSVHVFAIDQAPTDLAEDVGLVVVGGPTEAHRMTEPVARWFDQVGGALVDKSAAAFDTRLNWPRWMSGSAAVGIAARLRKSGAELMAPPVSFLVAGKVPVLEAGELEHAEVWARSIGERAERRVQAAAIRG